jgi:hypothetical protein
VGRRYEAPEPDAENPDQIGRFDGLACRYLGGAVDNLIKESNNHHRTIAATRLRLRYLAALIPREGGQAEIHFGSQYE